ncbi:phage portal protein, partial [Clostridium sporogenes]|nr:phage portal protein [Clostridium sporogenes]NFG00735.1 phage portal protein [Clostridium sporogenes]NFG08307.1 phage portal protein [Clostridium sporogenes]NFG53438.1 phage portal protein [Clostridium sporogenes]NFP86262.1 phage portal protein [Clostridium sporogenes]
MLGINVDGIDPSKIGEITYFTCLRILSETISKLPLKIYKETANGNEKQMHYLNSILRLQPNPYYSANTFWSCVEFARNHYGNAFVYIEKERMGRIKNLWILPSNSVQIYIDNKGIFKQKNALWYVYTEPRTGKQYTMRQDEVLHFKSWITDKNEGIIGLSVRGILESYITRGQYANKFLGELTKNGMITDKIIVHYTGDLNTKAEETLVTNLESFSSKSAGKFIPLPLGMTASNISSKLTDSQFLELNKYNALQIAGAFGIKPQFLNDYDKGNYANVELQQESMYKDTLLPILSQYEQELAIKLFTNKEKQDNFYFNFNVDAILRSSFKARLDAYAVAVNNSIMTPNECRD